MHRVAVVGLVALAFLAAPQALAQEPADGPEGLHVAYGEDATTSLTVTFSGPPAVEASVEVSPPGGDNRTVEAEANPLPGEEEAGYRATVDGLEPDTAYAYRAVLDGEASDSFVASTAPAGDANATRITMFADHGVPADRPTARHDGDAPLENMRLAAGFSAHAHLVAGDISYADGDAEIWDLYFQKNEPLWATTPTMTVPGNHEREAGQGYANYDARLTMPEADEVGRWWTVQVGNVQLVGLNSDTACAESEAVQAFPGASWDCAGGQDQAREPNEDQLAFVEETLQAAEEDPSVDWTVVQYHNPTYSTGPHGSNMDVQALWVPLFEEHGADLVLNGDDHLYQRTETLQEGEPADEGPVFIVNGAGGSDPYEFQDEDQEPPAWEATRYADGYGTLVLETDGDRLEGRFVTLNGTVVDRFALEGGAEGPPTLAPVDGTAEDDGAEGEAADEEDGDDGALVPAPGAASLVAGIAMAALAVSRAPRRSR